MNPCWKFAARLYKQKYKSQERLINNQKSVITKLEVSRSGLKKENDMLRKKAKILEKELDDNCDNCDCFLESKF